MRSVLEERIEETGAVPRDYANTKKAPGRNTTLARRSACRLQQQRALSGQYRSVIPSRGPARSVDPTPLCTSSNPKKALAAAHKEAALFQVEGLDDLAPLAATAPPGVPDLPEGDIIALGDEVGVSMIIIIIIIIIILILLFVLL